MFFLNNRARIFPLDDSRILHKFDMRRTCPMINGHPEYNLNKNESWDIFSLGWDNNIPCQDYKPVKKLVNVWEHLSEKICRNSEKHVSAFLEK